MTMLSLFAAQLGIYEAELQKMADWLQHYIPAEASRDDPIWSAWIRVGGAASECKRAARDLTKAEREKVR